MRRFSFRLEPLLRLKQQRLREAEARLIQANSHAENCRRQVQSLEAALIEAAERRIGEQVSPPAGQPDGLLHVWTWARAEQVCRLGDAIAAAEAVLADARRKTAEARQVRAAIHTQVEALRTRKQKQWEVYQRAVAHEQQLRLDERSLQRWRAGTESI